MQTTPPLETTQQWWHRLWPYVRQYRLQYGIGLFLVVLAGTLNTLSPVLLRKAVDDISAGHTQNLWQWAGLLVLAAITSFVLSWFNRQLLVVASRHIEHDMRMQLFKHMMQLDSYFYSKQRLGDILNRFSSDLNSVREMLAMGINMSTRLLMTLLVSVVSMYVVNSRLALVLSLVFPVIFGLVRLLLSTIEQRYRKNQEAFDAISSKSQENFSGIRVVKGFSLEQKELQAFQKLNQDYIKTSMALIAVDGPMHTMMGFLMSVASLVVLYVGGNMVIDKQLSIGQFVQFMAYVLMLGWPIMGLSWTVSLFQRGITSQKRLNTLWDQQPVVKDQPDAKPLEGGWGMVSLNNIGLELDGVKLLEGISLNIAAGQTLGITGKTGSGKTLLANLLTRQMMPTSGQMHIDQHPVEQLTIHSIRQHIAMVAQEPFLFSSSLADNINFGVPSSEVTPERTQQAARLSGVHDDIMGFPQQYNTILGERGITLSGGQRQRTALARAIMRQPDMLILDDALSAVDTETESRILQGLKSVLGQQTTVLIAHRVSTLQYADYIIVLDQGRIVQQGTPTELLAQTDGLYAQLERTQRLQQAVLDDGGQDGR